MQKVAFFDVDGTLFRSSLLIELVETCIKEGVFPPDTAVMFQKEYKSWLNREGNYEEYIDAVVRAFLLKLKGVPYGDFADIGQKVVEEQGKHTYRYTRDLIQKLQKENYYVVAISQSPKTVLDKFCTTHGFDKVYGRIYEIDEDDRFTGNISHLEVIEDKSNIVERVFQKDEYTREGSIGVGDTEGDIPLLQSVENPICFNPNMSLYTHAKKVEWPVVVERKDVIYELS